MSENENILMKQFKDQHDLTLEWLFAIVNGNHEKADELKKSVLEGVQMRSPWIQCRLKREK